MAHETTFAELYDVLCSVAAWTNKVVREFHSSERSHDRSLDEVLATVAGAHVDRASTAGDWDLETVLPMLSWSVHEVVEWVARMTEFETTGSFVRRDTLTWSPGSAYIFGSADYFCIAAERHALLLSELASVGVNVAPPEVAA